MRLSELSRPEPGRALEGERHRRRERVRRREAREVVLLALRVALALVRGEAERRPLGQRRAEEDLLGVAVAVAGVDVPRAGLVGHVAAHLGVGLRAAAEREPAREAAVRALHEHDVEDAAHAVGVVARARVGEHLDARDAAGRDLAQQAGELGAADRDGPAVDLHDDVLVAAQRHRAVRVDLDRRQRRERLQRRAARRDGLRLDVVDGPVGALLDELALADDLGRAERGVVRHEPQRVERDRLAGRDAHAAQAQRRVADEADAHLVAPRRHALDAERAVEVGRGTGDEAGVAVGVDGRRRARQRLAGPGVHGDAGEGAAEAGGHPAGRAGRPAGRLGVGGSGEKGEQQGCRQGKSKRHDGRGNARGLRTA